MPQDITGTEAYTNGPVEKPAGKDVGNDVFATLETFMERLATHNHTGADSKEISVNFQKVVQSLAVTVDYTWNSLGDSKFEALITILLPADENNMRKYFFKNTVFTDYQEFQPEVVRVSATQYKIVANDSTISDLRIVYF